MMLGVGYRWLFSAVRRVGVVGAGVLVLGAGSACAGDKAPQASGDTAGDMAGDTAHLAVSGNAVRGLALLTAFRDSLPSHSGNGLRCVSCHLENGTNPTALPWLGSAARYPRMRGRSAKMEDLAFRINDCITRSLAGQEVAEDSEDMRDMLAYMETLRTAERPPDQDTVQLTGQVGAGQQLFALQCARCHGAKGEGGVLAPALWGADSYSIGAGMARQWTIATFVRHNMPVDRAVTLTDQQAADVAAFVLEQPRQDYPGKELDWPKGNPPADAAYSTDAARALGKPQPDIRPVLPRRIPPHE